MYELYSYNDRNRIITTWIVVAAWKGDGRGKRGRKGMWRVTLAPLDSPHAMFQVLWNDRGKFLEVALCGKWTLNRQVK